MLKVNIIKAMRFVMVYILILNADILKFIKALKNILKIEKVPSSCSIIIKNSSTFIVLISKPNLFD